MSLNWNIEKVHDFESIKTDAEWPVTNAIIWLTMGIGLGEITITNAAEFYARIALLERLHGPALREAGGEPYHITYAHVVRRVGLTTNVSTETQASWVKRTIGRFLAERLREVSA